MWWADLFLTNIDGRVSRSAPHVDEIAYLLREDAELAGHVAIVKVRHGNRTPGEIAQDVATATAEVIGAGSAADSDFTVPALATRSQNAAPLALTSKSGMTWAQVHGRDVDDNLAVSIAGMTAVEIAAEFGTLPADGYTSVSRADGAYRGIPGFARCQGTCSVDTAGNAAGKLVGSWTFLPTSPNQGYVRNDDGNYALPTGHAECGHWLDRDSATGNAPRLNPCIGGTSAEPEPGHLSARAMDATNHDGNVAICKDQASGMSVTGETDADGVTESGGLMSGAFTAAVQLTARFGVDLALRPCSQL